ncbi:unnamed protein product [Durusdinium trenchii]|uniref:EF-hand domain-containing protein n=1 Tax=Durusdinium trenchii TaxID=1381693 RepID=A0ABP0QQA3_9DINO
MATMQLMEIVVSPIKKSIVLMVHKIWNQTRESTEAQRFAWPLGRMEHRRGVNWVHQSLLVSPMPSIQFIPACHDGGLEAFCQAFLNGSLEAHPALDGVAVFHRVGDCQIGDRWLGEAEELKRRSGRRGDAEEKLPAVSRGVGREEAERPRSHCRKPSDVGAMRAVQHIVRESEHLLLELYSPYRPQHRTHLVVSRTEQCFAGFPGLVGLPGEVLDLVAEALAKLTTIKDVARMDTANNYVLPEFALKDSHDDSPDLRGDKEKSSSIFFRLGPQRWRRFAPKTARLEELPAQMLKFLHREMKGNFDLPERLAWVKEEAWKRIRRLKALEKDYEKKMQDSTSTVALRQCDALERQLHQAWAKAAFKEEPTGTGKDLVACVDSVGADAAREPGPRWKVCSVLSQLPCALHLGGVQDRNLTLIPSWSRNMDLEVCARHGWQGVTLCDRSRDDRERWSLGGSEVLSFEGDEGEGSGQLRGRFFRQYPAPPNGPKEDHKEKKVKDSEWKKALEIEGIDEENPPWARGRGVGAWVWQHLALLAVRNVFNPEDNVRLNTLLGRQVFTSAGAFESTVGAVILLSTICTGLEIDLHDCPDACFLLSCVFSVREQSDPTIWIIIETPGVHFGGGAEDATIGEMVAKLWELRCRYFQAPSDQHGWIGVEVHVRRGSFSHLASVRHPLVPLGELIQVDYGGDLVLFRLVRLVRLLRLVKLLQVLRRFRNLWLMVRGLIESVSTLNWVILMLCLVMYIFAVCNLEAAGILRLAVDCKGLFADWDPECDQYFGTIPKIMYTLVQVLTLDGITFLRGRRGREDWIQRMESWAMTVGRPLVDRQPLLFIILLLFIFLTTFGLLNIIVGVIVENTLNIAQSDQELQDRRLQRQLLHELEFLRQVFEASQQLLRTQTPRSPDSSPNTTAQTADFDGSGTLDREEFVEICQRHEVKTALLRMEIPAEQPEELFDILDEEGGSSVLGRAYDNLGQITFLQFHESVKKVRGVPTAFDMKADGIVRPGVSEIKNMMVSVSDILRRQNRLQTQYERTEQIIYAIFGKTPPARTQGRLTSMDMQFAARAQLKRGGSMESMESCFTYATESLGRPATRRFRHGGREGVCQVHEASAASPKSMRAEDPPLRSPALALQEQLSHGRPRRPRCCADDSVRCRDVSRFPVDSDQEKQQEDADVVLEAQRRSVALALLTLSWADPALRGASTASQGLPSEEHPQKEREVGSPSTAGVDALDEEKQNETENDHENGEDDLGATLPTREGMPPLAPMRAVAYGALPCAMPHAQHYAPEMMSCNLVGLPSEDMMQEGYEAQWGPSGRNDLGLMKALGANAVRLYHSLGLDGKGSHQGFLNRAQKLKLNVMPGFHSTEPAMCDHFDCHDAWKAATLKGFKQGFLVDNRWHPAISTVILMNEPDFYDNDALCTDRGAWCRVKAVLSAMDGLLQAEEEAQVLPSDVKLTVTWSFAMRTSIDGKVQGPGTFGFQDMVAVMEDPSLVKYTPRTPMKKLREAFHSRWIHGLNTQAPWNFVSDFVTNHYKLYDNFGGLPWFIGEYGANGQAESLIISDLESMDQKAASDEKFLGSAFFQFQTAYSKGGSELNFGLFSIGDRKIGETGEVCDKNSHCRTWPVFCLGTKLPWFENQPALGKRAQALATAWGGIAENSC